MGQGEGEREANSKEGVEKALEAVSGMRRMVAA
jgi:hypothetical protein